MTFARILKELRRKADMTQEQLAETLSISPQAVSRWECELAMPDISLLPVLANLFDVTTDHLLGVDISKKAEKIEQIIREAEARGILGYKSEAVEIIRAGLREFPRSCELMYWLQFHLSFRVLQCEGEERTGLLCEIISLGERLVESCTDDLLRYNAIERLCRAYAEVGEVEKAGKLANSLPDVWINRETILAEITRGDAQFAAKRNELTSLLGAAITGFCRLNTRLDDGTWALSQGERITVYENILVLTEMLCPDGDFGSFGLDRMQAYGELAQIYLDMGDSERALCYLEKAAGLAAELDTRYSPDRIHTSLLLRGRTYGKICFGSTANLSRELLDELESGGYFKLLGESERGRKLIERLTETAGIR